METIDPAKAARVWQRVQGDAPVDFREPLQALIARGLEDASVYLQLSRQTQGKTSAVLRKMVAQKQAQAACLKGIYRLRMGQRPHVGAAKPAPAELEKTLQRCYGREMQCLAHYEQHSSDPEYGQIFARLAEQEKDHCCWILEILGSLQQ